MVAEFGPKLQQETWGCLRDGDAASIMVEEFENATQQLVEQHFPRKMVTITEGELPFFNEPLKKLRKKRDRVYQRTGKGQRYKELYQEFETKLKNETKKYQNKIINEVKDGKRGSGYSAIRKLGNGPHEWDKKKEFTIPKYVEEGLQRRPQTNLLLILPI